MTWMQGNEMTNGLGTDHIYNLALAFIHVSEYSNLENIKKNIKWEEAQKEAEKEAEADSGDETTTSKKPKKHK